ncbi:uncharacterized protein BKA78DRAFT_327384 [Phyllosticta capitalensis]|uniref:uncharacterized protein n=1 Tax=Phyllosticta capitalensis TaxID=121624 RepID=UPI00312F7950
MWLWLRLRVALLSLLVGRVQLSLLLLLLRVTLSGAFVTFFTSCLIACSVFAPHIVTRQYFGTAPAQPQPQPWSLLVMLLLLHHHRSTYNHTYVGQNRQ